MNESPSKNEIPLPLVVVSSNPQSGDCTSQGKKPPDVIELLDSSDEGESPKPPPPKKQKHSSPNHCNRRRSSTIGSTTEEAISLCDDNYIPTSSTCTPARTSFGSTKEDPIVFSDSGSSTKSEKKPFRMPAWTPRTKVSSETPVLSCAWDSSDDEQCNVPRAVSNTGPTTKATQKKIDLLILLDSSSEDDDDDDDDNKTNRGPFSRMAPQRRRTEKAHQEIIKIFSDDDTSDDEIPAAAFNPSRGSVQKTVGGQGPKDEERQGSSAKQASAAELKSPPVYPSSQAKVVVVTLPKLLDDDSKAGAKGVVVPEPKSFLEPKPRDASSPKVPPTPAVVVPKPPLVDAAPLVVPTITTSQRSPLHARCGAAHGSHLAPIFKNALAEHRSLDVQETQVPKRQRRILWTKGHRRTQRQPTHSPVALSNNNNGPVLSIKRVREPELKTEQTEHNELATESRAVSDEECEDIIASDEHFTGGEDEPIQIPAREQDLGIMMMIKHLSSNSIDKNTGLPVSKLSVLGNPDDIIYDFELNARKSSIPNSGNGVFLTFLGARELKPSRKRRGQELLDSRPYKEPKLSMATEASHPDGFGMSVTFKGEHLHGPYNSLHLLRTLKATIPDSKGKEKEIKVRFSDFELPYYEDELAALRDPTNRIGTLNLYQESDFVPAPKRTFSSLHTRCGWIDIGRYGPFRKTDRKIEMHFDVKSFIFSHEPSEWAFGVPDKISGQNQVIDITDDITGEPTEIAKQNIPMYVNEVGHNNSLKHTVHSLVKDDRTVQYYVKVDEPMRTGDTIEVFVNYFDQYEEVRNRKGYGRANLDGLEKSDGDLATLLGRNFTERKEMVHIIVDLSPMQLYLLIEWLETIRCELAQLIDAFIRRTTQSEGSTMPTSCPTAQQFVALRRLNWLSSLFQRRLEILKQAPQSDKPIVGEGIFDQCSGSLSHLNYPSWGAVFDILVRFPHLKDSKGVSIKNIFDREITEELCFDVKEKLVSPMDKSVWCDIAIRLTKSLCDATAKVLLQRQSPCNPESDCLVQIYMNEALSAAEEVRNPCNLNRLSFDSGFQGDCGLSKAALSELQRSDSGISRLGANIVMSRIGQVSGEVALNTSGELVGSPRPITSFSNQAHKIQETWYLCWQVIYVVDAFASKFVKNFSREKLCSSLGISVDTASYAIRKGIKIEEKNPIASTRRKLNTGNQADKVSTSRKKDKLKSKKRAAPQNKTGPLRANNTIFWGIIWPCLKDELDWHLEHGNRPGDFYACPPGVARGRGFKPRIDFFDSTSQILTFLKTNPSWSELPQVKKCLSEYSNCYSLYQKLKGTKAMPKFAGKEEMSKWLRSQVLAS